MVSWAATGEGRESGARGVDASLLQHGDDGVHPWASCRAEDRSTDRRSEDGLVVAYAVEVAWVPGATRGGDSLPEQDS